MPANKRWRRWYPITARAPGTSPISLGNWAGNEQHTYKFVVALDGTADNNYQGDTSTVAFTWNAA